jgi:hypothetical protein
MSFDRFHMEHKLATHHLVTDYIISPAQGSHEMFLIDAQDEAYTTTPPG